MLSGENRQAAKRGREEEEEKEKKQKRQIGNSNQRKGI
jgi:hypothetical protein